MLDQLEGIRFGIHLGSNAQRSFSLEVPGEVPGVDGLIELWYQILDSSHIPPHNGHIQHSLPIEVPIVDINAWVVAGNPGL